MKHHHPGVRVLLILVHLGWAAAVYHKPNAPLLLASYSRFDDMAPWHLWGWAALGIAFLMYFTRPGSLGAQLANFLSSIFFRRGGSGGPRGGLHSERADQHPAGLRFPGLVGSRLPGLVR
ncbi:hypothetical protein ACFSC4_30800 [Deinococcus malanensis]|uniref:hypothetical protein n=1 Tax=Deinococcus malanensis TaxID=1706855 RepID=UPI00362DC6A8